MIRFKRGQDSCSFQCCDEEGSCIFNSCIERGISAGVLCILGEPGKIPSSSPHLKAAGALPSFKSGHSSKAPAVFTVVMKREFHQVLPIYKGRLLKFPFQFNC